MRDDILTYREMCDKENVQTLQRGMNYMLNPPYGVILMSQRTNAPYNDEILSDGLSIIYEGHDVPRTRGVTDPKELDQPYSTRTGLPTQNGRFANAVKDYREGKPVSLMNVYEKIFSGVWSYRGLFKLVGFELISDGRRKVFKFRLELSDVIVDNKQSFLKERSRIIPTEVKKAVWVRDEGKCVMCGAKEELHFDHDLPYSKGGTSIAIENVKILCARHNLSKGAKIE